MKNKIFLLVLTFMTLTVPGVAQNKPFAEFLKEYTSAIFSAEQDSLLQQFWRGALRRGIPYIEENKTDVTFLYRGNDSVKILGDFTSWGFRIPFRHLPESDLWYLKLSFEPDARLDYMLVTGTGKGIRDPQNLKVAPGGFGDRSELAMPDFTPAPELEERRTTRKGALVTETVRSKSLGYDRKVFVHLPPSYETSRLTYSVVYFQNGSDYINFAKASIVLDNLSSMNSISPLIGVFIVPPTESNQNRETEDYMSALYEKFITTELVPFIDKKYRTEKKASNRLVMGASFGGLAALWIAFNNPELFSNVASQSGFVSFKNDSLFSLFQQSPQKPLRVYMTVGSYERNVGSTVPAIPESDYLMANRRFSKMLEQKQYQLRYREFHDGHAWGRWRTDLPNLLRWFFPKKD